MARSDRLEPAAGHAQQGRMAVLEARREREDGAGHAIGVEWHGPALPVGGGRGLADARALDELERGQGDEADPELAGVGSALEVAREEGLHPLRARVAA